MFREQDHIQYKGVVNASLAQHFLYQAQSIIAKKHAQAAWDLAKTKAYERDIIRAAARQGEAALALREIETAHERLHYALTRARKINLVQEELPCLIALAELARQQDRPQEAFELLDSVWDAAEHGPYPFFHADALNVRCQLERDAGDTEAAIATAQQAFQLALAQGEPHVYRYGLEKARKHLQELGVEV